MIKFTETGEQEKIRFQYMRTGNSHRHENSRPGGKIGCVRHSDKGEMQGMRSWVSEGRVGSSQVGEGDWNTPGGETLAGRLRDEGRGVRGRHQASRPRPRPSVHRTGSKLDGHPSEAGFSV